MARLLKCYGDCEKKYEKAELFNYKNKNYCPSCYRQRMKDDNGRKYLLDVISDIYKIPYPTGHMLRQMKQFKDDRNYEYEDQAKAILYSSQVLKKEMKTNYGLGLIPYVIDSAVVYYREQERRTDDMVGKEVLYESNVVKKLDKEFDKDEKRKMKIINMEDILK